MQRTGADVDAALAQVTPVARKRDAAQVARLLADVTGREAELWTGGIVGYGACHYRYPTGTEGDSPLIGFAPRKRALTLYLMDGVEAHREALAELGTHSTGVGCVYIPDVATVDEAVLHRILQASYRRALAAETSYGILTVLD